MSDEFTPDAYRRLHEALFDLVEMSFDIDRFIATDGGTANVSKDEPAWEAHLIWCIKDWRRALESVKHETALPESILTKIDTAAENFYELDGTIADDSDSQVWRNCMGDVYGYMLSLRKQYQSLNVPDDRPRGSVPWRPHCDRMLNIELWGLRAYLHVDLEGDQDPTAHAKYVEASAELVTRYLNATITPAYLKGAIESYLQKQILLIKGDTEMRNPQQDRNIASAVDNFYHDSIPLNFTDAPIPPADDQLAPKKATAYLEGLRMCCIRQIQGVAPAGPPPLTDLERSNEPPAIVPSSTYTLEEMTKKIECSDGTFTKNAEKAGVRKRNRGERAIYTKDEVVLTLNYIIAKSPTEKFKTKARAFLMNLIRPKPDKPD